MLKQGFFTFHLVDPSPWPLFVSVSLWMVMMNFLCWLKNSMNMINITLSLCFLLLSIYGWFRDISLESFLQGNHTLLVQKGLKLGMILFITSEVFFFLSFFWSLFYCSLSPSVELYKWAPMGVMPLDPMYTPLLGTLILISSGASVTWSHHSLLNNKKISSLYSLSLTITFGILFTILQLMEYMEMSFSISDSVYGSIFFVTTGFHGLHVIMGTLMLSVSLFRLYKNKISITHHIGLEMSIWYWHFVDVVWLFLYLFVYWWSL